MSNLIDGVQAKPLRVIPDERGRLMEILRCDDALFSQFGQVYMTTAYPGVVKGWHYHKVQTDNMAVVRGMMKLVLFDSREHSPTHGKVNEFFFGEHQPLLIQIPPLVFHGFKAVSECEAIVINIPTMPYNYKEPDEFRVHPHDNDIPYKWDRNDG
ncbi:dTDP-4-dehydrorhamnose 3,5-epimerase [Candidatus Moduliflexus flocculans]|uniref:dTDP-4-dehydrorhamnose 3,5-epimerase n=1 Tax=Candidatus Moduliflexus flocculans TaxID=1499966 RepID=A0A0S6W506_9BACT|nr:dTDP-4-dehydrorhamnose 3,5-epimerase [Candidatus Moduliflexus flocculans]